MRTQLAGQLVLLWTATAQLHPGTCQLSIRRRRKHMVSTCAAAVSTIKPTAQADCGRGDREYHPSDAQAAYVLKELCNPAVHCAGLEGRASGSGDDQQTIEGNALSTNMHEMQHSSAAETRGPAGSATDAGSTQRNNSDDVLDDLAGEDDAAELPEPDKQKDPPPSDMFAGLSLSG